MKAPVMIDSRDQPSTTLPMVWIAFIAVIVRYLLSGHFGYANMTGVELGAALAAVGGMWLWREGQARS